MLTACFFFVFLQNMQSGDYLQEVKGAEKEGTFLLGRPVIDSKVRACSVVCATLTSRTQRRQSCLAAIQCCQCLLKPREPFTC